MRLEKRYARAWCVKLSADAYELLNELSKTNSNIQIIIIGNNSIDGVYSPNPNRDTPFRIVTGTDPNGNETVDKMYRDDPNFGDYEKRFNLLRAQTIKDELFSGNPNAQPMARESFDPKWYQKLHDPSHDPVGITIFTKFSKPKKEKTEQREKYKTVRFL